MMLLLLVSCCWNSELQQHHQVNDKIIVEINVHKKYSEFFEGTSLPT